VAIEYLLKNTIYLFKLLPSRDTGESMNIEKDIEKRKEEHINLCLQEGVEYHISTGFDQFHFLHNALPELDLDEINTSTTFLNKHLSFPFLIEAMTGGCRRAEKINKSLAEIAEQEKVAFSVGSQRAMVEYPMLTKTYYVRDVAPTIPILANIGAPQLKQYTKEVLESIVSKIEANALTIHLNPLQEAIQPEGQAYYKGVLARITKVVEWLDVPIIVKETGAGISRDVAKRLKNVGIAWIDVAGAGGTSWSLIEYHRNKNAVEGFENWGIPTALSVEMVSDILPTIASGGIRNGIDGAKAICLGAKMFGAARPLLLVLEKNGKEGVRKLIVKWREQLKLVQFLVGAKEVKNLNKNMLFKIKP
jgi:isopentenyl-diphosphate delta-isomerase